MPTPLSLSDEELSLLRSLAEPVAYGQRREFLRQVAIAMATCPQPGPGATDRIARGVQRRFVLTRAAWAQFRKSWQGSNRRLTDDEYCQLNANWENWNKADRRGAGSSVTSGQPSRMG